MPSKQPRYGRLSSLLLCALLSGCSVWRWELGTPIDGDLPRSADNVTLGEALAQYGPPQRISASPSGYILAWEHWRIRENSLGFSLGVLGARFISIDWGNLRTQGDFVLLTFDRDYRLTAAEQSTWDSEIGGGGAVQPLAGFVSVVDADDLLDSMSQHRWGAALMQRLPEAINEHSDPHSGDAGIEQRATPTPIGQQSLEMH